jgi:hypothetical protein
MTETRTLTRRSLQAAMVVCLFLSGCQSAPLEPKRAAIEFVKALNAGDVGAMSSRSSTPFRFRQQEWTRASDHSGFVLGAATERVAPSPFELQRLLQEATATVKSTIPTPVDDVSSKAEALSTAPQAWSELNLILFRRGVGDVKHVAIVAVDAMGTVTGLYVN